jgi:hypothetical protein
MLDCSIFFSIHLVELTGTRDSSDVQLVKDSHGRPRLPCYSDVPLQKNRQAYLRALMNYDYRMTLLLKFLLVRS